MGFMKKAKKFIKDNKKAIIFGGICGGLCGAAYSIGYNIAMNESRSEFKRYMPDIIDHVAQYGVLAVSRTIEKESPAIYMCLEKHAIKNGPYDWRDEFYNIDEVKAALDFIDKI